MDNNRLIIELADVSGKASKNAKFMKEDQGKYGVEPSFFLRVTGGYK